MEHYNDSDYLYHYGVLGMKWGQRRARIASEKSRKYANRAKGDRLAKLNRGADWNAKRSKKFAAKAKKIEAKHRGRAGDKAYNRVKNTSTGKLILQSSLMGTYGTFKYQQAKAKGNSTGKAVLKGLLGQGADSITRGGVSIVEPRVSAAYRKSKQKKSK